MAWSPDGTKLAIGSYDGTVHIWDVETLKPLGRLFGHTTSAVDVAWSPDSKRIVSASWDGTIRVWDAE
ncbi:hypothetical protein KFU94_59620 [Chloroflexi bacterium TSY]|nr:hypothetical protein [Chloroflexi bacterium TSY]